MLRTGNMGMRRFIFMRCLLEVRPRPSDVPDPLAQDGSKRRCVLFELGGTSELGHGPVLSEPFQKLFRVVDLHAAGGRLANSGSEVEDDADARLRPQVRRGE